MEEVLLIPIEQKVVHIGCMHETTYPAAVLIPAYNADLPLNCPRCLSGRQWRLSHEAPGTIRGRSRLAPRTFLA